MKEAGNQQLGSIERQGARRIYGYGLEMQILFRVRQIANRRVYVVIKFKESLDQP